MNSRARLLKLSAAKCTFISIPLWTDNLVLLGVPSLRMCCTYCASLREQTDQGWSVLHSHRQVCGPHVWKSHQHALL